MLSGARGILKHTLRPLFRSLPTLAFLGQPQRSYRDASTSSDCRAVALFGRGFVALWSDAKLVSEELYSSKAEL